MLTNKDECATLPPTDPDVEHLLCHFEHGATDAKTAADTVLVPLVFTTMELSAVLRSARNLITFQGDATCNTNRDAYKMHFITSSDGDNKTNTVASSYLKHEDRATYNFLYCIGLRLVYGTALNGVTVVCLDGNEEALQSMTGAIPKQR